jgi:iron complex outermembrane receptor protein
MSLRCRAAAAWLAALCLVHTLPPAALAEEPETDPSAAAAADAPPGTPAEADPGYTTHTPVSQKTDYDEIVVTAAPHSRRRFDVIQGTTVLSHEELERSIQSNLGETLAELPGISSTYFGPGASRPVIRGLDGPRIRVLQNGLGTLDASVTSPDHAVLADPLAAQRVEIIRGAGTLAYGTSAIGGVVNVDDGRIPRELPGDVVEGDVRALYGSAADEKSAGAGVTTALGPVAFRGAGFFRGTNDLEIPGFAPSDALRAVRPDIPTGPYGIALDTGTDSRGGTLGASWIGDEGLLGAAFGVDDSSYGVPSEPGEEVRIDLLQRRFDVNGTLDRELFAFEQTSFKYGYAHYEHTENEDGLPATQIENRGQEARLDLVQKPFGDLHGSVGAQVYSRDFSALGSEAYLPPSDTLAFGFFAIEEYHLDPLTFEAGLRYERVSIAADGLGFDRDFDTISFSAGVGWEVIENWLIGLSLSRTERAPAAEELLSDGPHLATGGFEIGDPGLDKETGLTIEATARKRRGRWNGGVNFYWTRFDDFIVLQSLGFVDENGTPDPTGDLVLRRYVPQPVDFVGAEVTGAVDVIQTDDFRGVLDVAVDYVRATARNATNDRIPRIPPLRVKGGIEGRSRWGDLRLELWWVDAQDRTAAFELPTDAYLMVNLIGTLHPFPDRRNVTLIVQGRNLANEEGRVASSFLKQRLPLPGREARVGIRVAF